LLPHKRRCRISVLFNNMSEKLKWGQRTFQFTFPVEVYPEIIERLRGTPARLEVKVSDSQITAATYNNPELVERLAGVFAKTLGLSVKILDTSVLNKKSHRQCFGLALSIR
jgi:hypothetical protein